MEETEDNLLGVVCSYHRLVVRCRTMNAGWFRDWSISRFTDRSGVQAPILVNRFRVSASDHLRQIWLSFTDFLHSVHHPKIGRSVH